MSAKRTTPSTGQLAKTRLDQKLLAYSASAGAALLLNSAAHGQGQTISLFSSDGGSTFSTSVPTLTNNGGTATMIFVGKTTGGHAIQFDMTLASGFGHHDAQLAHIYRFVGRSDSNLSKLPAHTLIFGKNLIAGADFNASLGRNSNGGKNGAFAPAFGVGNHVTGYIGFKTTRGDYGWLNIKVSNNNTGGIGSITFEEGSDGVYGQIGSSSVETDGTVSAIPEPATVASGLGLLALGAAGVREMRRRRRTPPLQIAPS